MNLVCSYCQTPFTLSMTEKVAALRKMEAENLRHYDAICPARPPQCHLARAAGDVHARLAEII